MSPLITGSLAYDYLIQIDGRFSEQWQELSPGNASAAYLAPTLTHTFGGCAANISYALHKLNASPVMMATAGSDFTRYADYLHTLDISTQHVLQLQDFYTAQAYIITDSDNNQLTAFHPGATAEAHRQHIAAVPPPPLAIVSPNGKAGMIQHSRALAAAGIPFIFDPGQAINMFTAAELKECLTLAPYAIFNADEFTIAQQITGMSGSDIASLLQALFITRGEQGSEVISGGNTICADCARFGDTQDPTGCGDAYRAGLLYGLIRQWQWQPLLNFAAVIAALKAVHNGAQGYPLSLATAADFYHNTFSQSLPS